MEKDKSKAVCITQVHAAKIQTSIHSLRFPLSACVRVCVRARVCVCGGGGSVRMCERPRVCEWLGGYVGAGGGGCRCVSITGLV